MEFLYVIFVVLFAVVFQCWLYKRHAFDRLDYSLRFDAAEAEEGEEVHLVETVENRKALPLPWLRSEITTSEHLHYAGTQSVVTNGTRFVPSFFVVKAFQRTVRSWKVKCMRRGVYRVEKSVLLSTDLLGMADTSVTARTDAEITVLPTPADLAGTFASARKISGDVVVRRRYLEDPFYTAGVREYTQRDSLNQIHWPATAKTGTLMVHNNQCTAEQNLLILLNMQSTESGVELESEEWYLELGIRACAGFLEDTLRSGLPVRLAVNVGLTGTDTATVTNEFSGAEHVRDLMRLLARLPNSYSSLFGRFLDDTCRDLTASDIVLITPFFNRKVYEFVRMQQERGVFVKVIYTRPLEEEWPEDVDVYSYIGEAGAR